MRHQKHRSKATRFPRIASLLVSILALPWLATGQQGTGSIDGLVKMDQGGPIGSATISYGRLVPASAKAAAGMYSPVLTVKTDARGSFTISNLAAATYLLCIQVPGGAYLDPCHWSNTPPTFTVAAGQAVHGALISLAKGQQVPITISDPQSFFDKEGTTPGARLVLGVMAPSGAFHAATLSSKSALSRTYTVTIPFDSPTKVFIQTGTFQVVDAGHAAVTPGSQAVSVTASSTSVAPSLSFSLQGIGPP